MSEMEITPVTFVADYVGQPGHRAFFLQASGAEGNFTVAIEKQQVQLLAEKLSELLLLVDAQDTITGTEPQRDPALTVVQPVQPAWRVGTIALAYEEEADRVVVVVEPMQIEEEGEGVVETDETPGVRLLLRRDQVRAFILHAVAAAEEGRPLCQLCGLPMDPEGHACPASNGHRPRV
ncbi:MAG: hypothetical protein QOH26_607 [Actinomycetota bacterium]|nr:hypothetical protein [Actinomycetota bacterium]